MDRCGSTRLAVGVVDVFFFLPHVSRLLFQLLACGVCVGFGRVGSHLSGLCLRQGCWLAGVGIGRISWSLGLACMLPGGLSMFFLRSQRVHTSTSSLLKVFSPRERRV